MSTVKGLLIKLILTVAHTKMSLSPDKTRLTAVGRFCPV